MIPAQPILEFRDVTLTYDGAASPCLEHVSLTVPEGDLVLVVGGTGSGKTSFLQSINGLVPHFTGGTLTGEIEVAGRSTATHPPRELADVVGIVRQDPRAGFVTDVVEDELAYTMESLGIAAPTMRRRVEEVLDIMGLVELRQRSLRTLSGGQRQRVAIGSVLTAQPEILVLDEPTSALDPPAAEEVLATVQRLVHDLGLTVLISEHRLERVIQYADQTIVIENGRANQFATMAEGLAHSPVQPPIVELARQQGWQPLPMSIRDARRQAAPLRQALADWSAPEEDTATAKPKKRSEAVAQLHNVKVQYGQTPVLDRVNLRFEPGQICAVMGRNGVGKSTILHLLTGSKGPQSGTVSVGGKNPADLRGPDLISQIAMVPQEPESLLWAESVAAECAAADKDSGLAAGTTLDHLREYLPDVPGDVHPGDLSEGSRLLLVLAIMLAGDPPLLLLDEPTRGLDYPAKEHLSAELTKRAAAGTSIVMATHDVELVAGFCDRVVLLADGEVVTDSPARTAVVGSPAFAPQTAKIMSPLPFLTPAEVAAATDLLGPYDG